MYQWFRDWNRANKRYDDIMARYGALRRDAAHGWEYSQVSAEMRDLIAVYQNLAGRVARGALWAFAASFLLGALSAILGSMSSR